MFGSFKNCERRAEHAEYRLSAQLEKVTPQELKNLPCILVAPSSQYDTEQEYYRSVTGIEGEFIFAENPDEARLMLIGRKGFLPTDGKVPPCAAPIARVPLMRGDDPIMRHYCAFWKKDSSGYYAEGFADILKSEFEK